MIRNKINGIPIELDEVGDSHYDVDQVYHNKTSLKRAKGQYKMDLPNVKQKNGFQFSTPDGTTYRLNLAKIKGYKTGRMGLNVEFFDLNSDSPYDISGKGNALKVFSTVKATIAKYISEDPSISFIAFTAKNTEPSRVKLYKMFANQFSKYFPGFTQVEVEKFRDSTGFRISKPLEK